MKIAIIGAGFTGLSAAWNLSQSGYDVSLFESSQFPGGLAAGFKPDESEGEPWEWSLEHHYHHIFASDKSIINWVRELGLSRSLFFNSAKTSMRYDDRQFRLDSPLSLLACPVLSPWSKVRTAFVLALLKTLPLWEQLEKFTVKEFLIRSMGNQSWSVLWEPLMLDKFGSNAETVNAAWFWARIHARTPRLGYFAGGFGQLAQDVVDRLQEKHVRCYFSTSIRYAAQKNGQWQIEQEDGSSNFFDAVLFTSSAMLLSGLVPELPESYLAGILRLKAMAARTLILELDKPFFTDNTYWLNVNEKSWPLLAVVEHTNMISPQHYGNKTIVYIGKYLDPSNPMYSFSKEQLLDHYKPYLDQLSPGFLRSLSRSWSFAAPFAQPVVEVNHSYVLPPIKTPLEGLYWASMQHIYPWDRGTNFAVKLGQTAAQTIRSNIQ